MHIAGMGLSENQSSWKKSPFPETHANCRNISDSCYSNECLSNGNNKQIAKANFFSFAEHAEYFSELFQQKNNDANKNDDDDAI